MFQSPTLGKNETTCVAFAANAKCKTGHLLLVFLSFNIYYDRDMLYILDNLQAATMYIVTYIDMTSNQVQSF